MIFFNALFQVKEVYKKVSFISFVEYTETN